MPLHLKELQKHTEQNDKIIDLLTKLTDIQQPKKEVVLNKPRSKPMTRGNKK